MDELSFFDNHLSMDFVSDSRKANLDSIFFALRGTKSDGHDFIRSAYDLGCRCFVVEDDTGLDDLKFVSILKVDDSSSAWAKAWKLKAKNPDHNLFLVGITGTNGKTSTSLMVEHILNHFYKHCGVLGTIDHHLELNTKPGEEDLSVFRGRFSSFAKKTYKWETALTTPGADILFPRLNEMKELGAVAAALEISSHALDQNRARDLELDSAIFTNMTNDHLDYHKTMEHYFSSKIKLFEETLKSSNKKNKVSVLNYEDKTIRNYWPDFGQVEILFEVPDLSVLKSNKDVSDLLLQAQTKNKNSKINIVSLKKYDLNGLKFSLILDYKPEGDLKILDFEIPILGKFQMLNWCQAVLSLTTLNLDHQKIISAAKNFKGVPGRLQKVLDPPLKQKDLNSEIKAVFVDYAHTPDALKRTLQSLREVCKGRLGVVFGCGGDRDVSKRPVMGQIAEEFSDFQILTNDNPRSEDPNIILNQILLGFKNIKSDLKINIQNNLSTEQPKKIEDLNIYIESDRKQAIKLGLDLTSDKDDILLIAGKGHEDYQILKDQTIRFSDYQMVLNLL